MNFWLPYFGLAVTSALVLVIILLYLAYINSINQTIFYYAIIYTIVISILFLFVFIDYYNHPSDRKLTFDIPSFFPSKDGTVEPSLSVNKIDSD